MNDKEIKTNLNYYAAYFEAMFWADIDGSDDIKGIYDISDISQVSMWGIFKDLDSFFDQAGDILEETEYTHEQACHDFYLTRCGHGVGFWEADHCTEEQGEKLTEIAQSFGTVDITESDGKLYID